jgi:hypothetical protein
MSITRRETGSDMSGTPLPSRAEILTRYRGLREISKKHHHEILNFVSTDFMLRQARRLGLAVGRTLVLDDIEEMNYVYDLTIHAAPALGRSRAIDRYARSAKLAPDSDEALVLDAMRKSRFSLLIIERRHETAGLIATDLVRNSKVWLMDVGLESSIAEGTAMATRLYTPETFSMTAGANVPFAPELETFQDILAELPRSLGDKAITKLIDDPRLAEAIYSIALASGISDRLEYRDMSAA